MSSEGMIAPHLCAIIGPHQPPCSACGASQGAVCKAMGLYRKINTRISPSALIAWGQMYLAERERVRESQP